ncbi:MAG: peptidoglycan DD-metalloendopeptidase family protein [Minisyncoccia bacterium]|jgi:murein DD-endopeptidase MepM/ murein hydrolase activator NlpD
MKIKIFVFVIFVLFFIAGFFVNLAKEEVFFFNNNFDINFDSKIKNQNLKPKIYEARVWEVNLSKNQIYFFENGKLKEIIPISYQAPEGVWYQTPTGYFRVGIKKEKHISSIFPVYMNYAVQMYEDFFIHEIPYYLNGERVSSDFTGGCIRLWPKFAKKFFELAKPGDLIISYKDLDDFKVKEDFVFPVNKNEFYVRQRFNNPLRTSWLRGPDRSIDYIQHAGVDLAPNPDAKDLNVYNIYDGKIVKIVRNGENDHGLGNVVITQINADTTQINADEDINDNQNIKDQRSSALDQRLSVVYALYAHLSEINPKLKEGDFIKKGEIIGKVGATGYGCNYWRIGEDGCDKNSKLDVHLHFEIKEKPVLQSPKPAKCFFKNRLMNCYGYVPHNPINYGYFDPLKFLGK